MSSTPDTEINKIFRLTNKTDFDFTPAMGAMYGGIAYPIPAGKSLLAPKPMAKLLAKHLARQVFIKKAPIRDEKETDGKGTDRALWTEEDIQRTAEKFLADEYEEAKPEPQSEAQRMAEKVRLLNEAFPTSSPSSTVRDKAEVIAELEKKGIPHDKRSTKEKLEALLK